MPPVRTATNCPHLPPPDAQNRGRQRPARKDRYRRRPTRHRRFARPTLRSPVIRRALRRQHPCVHLNPNAQPNRGRVVVRGTSPSRSDQLRVSSRSCRQPRLLTANRSSIRRWYLPLYRLLDGSNRLSNLVNGIALSSGIFNMALMEVGGAGVLDIGEDRHAAS